MKRYRLLKDLPYAKAGEVFERKTHKSEDGLSDYDYLEIRKRVRIGEDETRFGVKYNGFLNNFNEWFEEIKETVWKPKTGDTYRYINSDGIILLSRWSNDDLDNARYEIGNCYRTDKEAEHAQRVQIARTIIKQSSDFKPDWDDDNQEKWYVAYDHSEKCLCAERCFVLNNGAIVYYKTIEDTEQAIEDLEPDYLLHFGVEE